MVLVTPLAPSTQLVFPEVSLNLNGLEGIFFQAFGTCKLSGSFNAHSDHESLSQHTLAITTRRHLNWGRLEAEGHPNSRQNLHWTVIVIQAQIRRYQLSDIVSSKGVNHWFKIIGIPSYVLSLLFQQPHFGNILLARTSHCRCGCRISIALGLIVRVSEAQPQPWFTNRRYRLPWILYVRGELDTVVK